MPEIEQVSYTISDSEFQKFREFLYRESGISLGDHKKSLVISRLSKRLRNLGLNTFSEYYDYVSGGRGDEEFIRMLDLLSTNKTDFFREQHHFDFLAESILPEIAPHQTFRVWSSACSSGEEPYSIAMTLCEGLGPSAGNRCKILASDLSTRVLDKAMGAVYEMERVSSLDKLLLKRFFLRGSGSNHEKVKVKHHVSKMVLFRRINLMDDRFPIKTPLDLIFCRNVMIYFDRPTQERLVGKFYRYLKEGGYLFIGHSESLNYVKHPFKQILPTIYRK
ncbi:protein-glutamate O-methyltransferase [Nitrospira defluvii]|nr:protein-glutamate O-methyltransferase [Nitrospira defluvii]